MQLSYILMMALINSCIELEVSSPSFPMIKDYFGVSSGMVSLTIVVNMIGFCLGALIYGPMSDSKGRRKTMIFGNAVLTIGAVGCVIAPTMKLLLFARLLQGFGAATSAVVVSAIIADRYTLTQATKLYSQMNALFIILMAVSPLLGGWLTYCVGWRGNYMVIALVCIVALGLIVHFLPETHKEKQNFCFKNLILNYNTILSSRLFFASSVIPSVLYGGYAVFITFSPFIYFELFQLKFTQYLGHISCVILTFAIASSVYSRCFKYSEKIVVNGAMVLIVLSGSLLACSRTPQFLTLSMSLYSIGFALLYPPIFSRSMEIFPKLKGTASSLIMSMRYLMCAVLCAIPGMHSSHSLVMMKWVFLGIASVVSLLSLDLLYKGFFKNLSNP